MGACPYDEDKAREREKNAIFDYKTTDEKKSIRLIWLAKIISTFNLNMFLFSLYHWNKKNMRLKSFNVKKLLAHSKWAFNGYICLCGDDDENGMPLNQKKKTVANDCEKHHWICGNISIKSTLPFVYMAHTT